MRRPVSLLAAVAVLAAAPAFAQLTPPSTGGYAALDLALRRLGHNKRVLLIGAHPDDEDTELLTILARAEGAQVAYLAVNRGEGGQNGIGPELDEALGVLRSEELLAARRLDGARQFFTRAYDFGYSRSIEETFRFWPRDTVLRDVVRVIRAFRPQVVVTTFVGAPREGHAQHRVAGLAAIEAFEAAGDSTRFSELWTGEGLRHHRPLKLYRSARFDTAGTTVVLEGGRLDPVVGKSYHQIAMASRSMHRSQDFGLLQRPGPSRVQLALLDDGTGQGGGGAELFAGVDTSLAGPAPGHDAARLTRYRSIVDSARAVLHPARLATVARLLAVAAALLDSVELSAQRDDLRVALVEQRQLVAEALTAAAGVVVDAVAEREGLVAGQAVGVSVSVWNAGPEPVRLRDALVPDPGRLPRAADGTSATPAEDDSDVVAPGAVVTRRSEVRVPHGLPITRPYYLEQPRSGALYRWPPPASGRWTEPFGPPPVRARVQLEILGRPVTVEREVVYRYSEQALGEVRRPVHVVPRIGVALDPTRLVWPAAGAEPRVFTVTLTNHDTSDVSGTVALELPAGWPAADPQAFSLSGAGARRSFRFPVRLPGGVSPGAYRVAAVARAGDGIEYRESVISVEYPHIRPRFLADSAVATVRIADLVLPPVTRVGYIRGASDRVPEALRAVGLPIEILDDEALRRADLRPYDAIVVGSRAYEINPVLVEHNARLIEYTRAGGLLIVQYQQYQFVRGRFAPYPLDIARPHDRVTDQTAAPILLAPEHAVFHAPNPIGPSDWEGWVQERGLYFPATWDPAYQPLLALADPGEEPKRGALLVASAGRGTYVYTGLSFFRQLPAGVPGAFRLFANLLALGRDGR